MRNKITKHHIIPQSRKIEWYNTDNAMNIKNILSYKHENFHKLFVNQTPKEQLKFIYQINEKVMSYKVSKMIKEIIGIEDEQFYKQELINKEK